LTATSTTSATSNAAMRAAESSSLRVSFMPPGGAADRSGAQRLWRRQAISETANRFYELTRHAEFGTKPLDMHVHRSGLDVWRCLPHGFQQMTAVLHTPAPLGEGEQKTILGWCEINFRTVHRYPMRRPVDAERPDGKRIGLLRATRTHTTNDGSHAKDQLLRAERLREVVVCTECKAPNAITFLASCSEHQYRDVGRCRIVVQRLEYLVAGETR